MTMIMTTFYSRCQVCREKLDGSCFTKFGQFYCKQVMMMMMMMIMMLMFYCKQDFYRMFGPRCAACHLVFTLTDTVRYERKLNSSHYLA